MRYPIYIEFIGYTRKKRFCWSI